MDQKIISDVQMGVFFKSKNCFPRSTVNNSTIESEKCVFLCTQNL